MSYCDHPDCSNTRIKALNSAHSFLCSKSSYYHSWHHHKHHKHVHRGVLAVYVVAIVGLIVSNIIGPISTHAASATWDINTAGDYTYVSDKIDFSEAGVAKLKAAGTPGNDWIADEGGASWKYRRPITVDITGNTTLANGYVANGSISGADAAAIYGSSLASGNDFRIVYWDGATTITSVMRDLVSFSASSIQFYFKTQAELSANDTTHYFIYYGNASATAPTVDKTQIYNNTANIATGGTASASDTWSGTLASWMNDGFVSSAKPGHGGWGNNNIAGSRAMIKLPATRKIWKVVQYWGGDDTGGWGRPNGQYFPVGYKVQYTTDNSAVAGDTAADAKWTSLSDSANGLTVSRIDTTEFSPVSGYGTTSLSGSDITTGINGIGCVNCWGTSLVNTFKPLSSLSTRFTYNNTGYIGTLGEFFIYPINATEATAEPTLSFGSQSGIYPADNPTLVPNTAQGYSTLSAFATVQPSESTGTIKYQISPNDGTTWYWWNGSAWVVTSAGYTESNTAAVIDPNQGADPITHNDPINNFTAGSGSKIFKWRAYFNSNGSQLPKLDSVALTYVWDTGNPNNVASFTSAKSQSSGGVDLGATDGSVWYSYPTPSFTWSNPGDTANSGETESGISTYYVCFNTNPTCHPVNEGAPQSGTTYTASNLVSGQTYYFRIRTKDNAGNVSATENQLFTYKYDGNKPDAPHYLSAPSVYSSSKAFTITWPITSDASAAEDTGGSGLLGYQYKINEDTTWYGSSHTGAVDDIIPYTVGTFTIPEADYGLINNKKNTFYLRTLDNAGNISDTTREVPLFYNATAPDPPTVNVNPTYNTVNDFSFSWSAATGKNNAKVVKYYYSVNDPDFTNRATQNTTGLELNNKAWATKQSPLKNRFCVVAEDDAVPPNANFGNPTCVEFEADTPAPGAPISLKATDQSIRTVKYKVGLNWYSPTYIGTGVAYYNVYRKNELGEWPLMESRTTTDYTDNNVEVAKTYSYKVTALDSANKESNFSSIVEISPIGEYESPASIIPDSLEVAVTSRTAKIHWDTDSLPDPGTQFYHKTDSMVAYGKTETLEEAKISENMVTSHTIDLDGLDPNTKYYYRVSGTDDNNNKTLGEPNLSFTTALPTTISNMTVTDIRQTSALIKWETNRVTTTELNYGESLSYGKSYSEGEDSKTTIHKVILNELKAGTKYNFQIKGKDGFDDIIISDNYTSLETLPYPTILNITFQPIKTAASTTIEVAWTTNVDTDGRVQFASTDGVDMREEYSGDFTKDHKFTIGEGKLRDQKTYLFKASVRDRYTNEATSENQSYTTPEDTRPPVVTNLQTEVSVEGSGDTAKVSAIVTWDTDEPSDSQVFYGTGTSGDFSNSTGKDSAMATSHLVVLSDLKAAQTYHVKAVSADKSGNSSESPAQNFVTNQASQSVINIILTRLQQTFGWMTSFSKVFGG